MVGYTVLSLMQQKLLAHDGQSAKVPFVPKKQKKSNVFKLLYEIVVLISQPEKLLNVIYTCGLWPINNGKHFSRIYCKYTTTNNVAQLIYLSLANNTQKDLHTAFC